MSRIHELIRPRYVLLHIRDVRAASIDEYIRCYDQPLILNFVRGSTYSEHACAAKMLSALCIPVALFVTIQLSHTNV